MKIHAMLLVAAMAYGLAACGGDPCDGRNLSGASAERAAPAVPVVTVGVLVDAGNTVIIELVSTTAGACSSGFSQTTRLVWDPVRRTAAATTAVPSSSARRVPGAMLGGGVTTWESVIPGLTIRAINSGTGSTVLNFTVDGASTTSLTCSSGVASTCTPG